MSSKKNTKLNRTFPGRVKNETKSRSPMPFKRFADFLTLRRKKRKGGSSQQLEKQPWFHGKITAEYVEMLLRNSGEFLVREDPAMPGSCFVVVRNREQITVHLAITKSRSSKGNRIKYRIEDSDYSFDGIPELVNFYVSERRPVSIRPPAVLTIAVSRETALLNEEDFRGRLASAGSTRINRITRRLERKSSDPVLSQRVPSNLYDQEVETELAAVKAKERPQSRSNPPSMCFEDKSKSSQGEGKDTSDKMRLQTEKSQSWASVQGNGVLPNRHHYLSSTTSAPMLSRKSEEPKGTASSTYASPRSIAIPSRVKHVVPYSEQGKTSQKEDPRNLEVDTDYAIPSSFPFNDVSLNTPMSPDRDMDYDFPRTATGSKAINREEDVSKCDNKCDTERDRQKKDVATESEAPKIPQNRHGIYLSVLQKLRDAIVRPFLEYDCVTLARHMTKVDLEVVWTGHEDAEEPNGGVEGLETMILPQGREIRCALLRRYTNLTHWVGALVLAAGDLASRTQIVTKLIKLADVLSDKQGNLVSFMAVIDGLALPQVNRLHHTWSCLHHQYSTSAILFHSTLKPLAGLLTSGAPSPFPGVCLPYVVPLARLLEMCTEEDLEDWAHDDVDQGIETLLAHLDAGRTLIQQIEAFKYEAEKRMKAKVSNEESKVTEYFRSQVNVGDVLGLATDPNIQTQKLVTLLSWLSENAERVIKPVSAV